MKIAIKILFRFYILVFLFSACGDSPIETKFEETYLGAAVPIGKAIAFKKGLVGTEGVEFGMAVNPDLKEFYFTRLSNTFSGTIYASKLQNNNWTSPEPASFSGVFNDTDPFITADGQRLYFTSKRPLPGQTQGNVSHIWYVTRNETGWSNPIAIQFNLNSIDGENRPTLTSTGRLYFMANYTDKGGEGLYYSDYSNGTYLAPVFCNVMVNNSSFIEVEPFISPDEKFILFYSAGRNDNFTQSTKVGDIYIAKRNTNGTWSQPQNLGSMVNSTAEESHPYISPDGKYLFFSRNVGQSNGFVDIFCIDVASIQALK